nr:membrane protein [Dactylosporangium thailandense]
MWWVIVVVAVVVAVATYLTWLAARVDRLHARAVAAYATLDAHLVRRAAAAVALAEAAQLPTLMYAAKIALDAQPDDREVAENDLTRHLRLDFGATPVDDTLVQVSRRVALARQVHNDVVRDALAVRRRGLVRVFRLARKHPVPAYFDVDDPSLS